MRLLVFVSDEYITVTNCKKIQLITFLILSNDEVIWLIHLCDHGPVDILDHVSLHCKTAIPVKMVEHGSTEHILHDIKFDLW